MTLRQRMEYGDAGMPDQPAAGTRGDAGQKSAGAAHSSPRRSRADHGGGRGLQGQRARQVPPGHRRRADPRGLRPGTGQRLAGHALPGRLAAEPQQTLADREGELLETTAYRTTSSVDALNRVKRMQFPQDVEGKRRELRPGYNRAGGLERVFLDDTLYVERIAYNAKGQRALIAYGNGVMTRYAYDPHTFRLVRLRSERYTQPDDFTYHPTGEALQDFGYEYDLAGNILGHARPDT